MNNFFLSLGFIVAMATCAVELLDLNNKRTVLTQNPPLKIAQN